MKKDISQFLIIWAVAKCTYETRIPAIRLFNKSEYKVLTD